VPKNYQRDFEGFGKEKVKGTVGKGKFEVGESVRKSPWMLWKRQKIIFIWVTLQQKDTK